MSEEPIKPSIGNVGDAYDNAPMECVIGLFKTECVRTTVFHSGPFKTIAEVESCDRRMGRVVTPDACTVASATSRPSSTSKPTTRPSTASRNPYESGREPGAVQDALGRLTPIEYETIVTTPATQAA